MAHPNKKESTDSHNAKVRSMTRSYGEASPAMNIKAPVNRPKINGPEDNVNFGADYSAPSARADKSGRKSVTANPVATYAKGGKVKYASGGDVSAIEEANKDQTQTSCRARGGRLKGKHHTHVNVIVAPQGGNQPPGGPGGMMPPPNLAALAGGPKPPMGMPPPGAALPPGAPPMGMPPGAPPPGAPPMMRKRGGAANEREHRDLISSNLKDEGLKQAPMAAFKRGGRVHDRAEEKEDRAITKSVLREEGLIKKARGGGISIRPAEVASTTHPTDGKKTRPFGDGQRGGSDSGVGRLEKVERWAKYGDKSKQEV